MPTDFPSFFRALWGHDPFPWQTMLAERGTLGHWPEAISLPTASGKTACLDAAIYSLAMQADRPLAERIAPRRIWFVVDRRIVVDEAHERAGRLSDRLAAAESGPLKAVADRLRSLSGGEQPLAVAKLRGGIRRNDTWAFDPAQPAILCSTVDQLGSSLLFRSYGHGDLTASIWAGLAAHDSLVLLDEAHCAVPFLQTLRAVASYRGSSWSEQPVVTPFACTIFSATLPKSAAEDITPEKHFPIDEAEKVLALDHDLLRQRMTAPKPAQLDIAPKPPKGQDSRSELAPKIVELVQEHLKRHPGNPRIAVMVNRVATAQEVERLLKKEQKGEVQTRSAETVLITGRMRPLDRDELVQKWSPILAATPSEVPRTPIIVVTTQCLEVGADFSFDALVTECASLDALRQRFGRLDRLGKLRHATATIIACESDTKEPKAEAEDPIYGRAIYKTWQWLQSLRSSPSDTGTVDFSINAMDTAVAALLAEPDGADRFSDMLAPAPDAPVLLPAHLDLLCQTAPRPDPEPDIALFLHGKRQVATEVQVLWRADLPDLTDETQGRLAIDLLSLLPPTSPETLSVPLHRLKTRLIERQAQALDEADVEGGRAPDDAPDWRKPVRPATSGSAFIIWAGSERSRVERDPAKIRPGDTVVLPAAVGLDGLAQGISAPSGLGVDRFDLAEAAALVARPRAVLRLQSQLWASWSPCAALADLLKAAEAEEFDRAEFLSAWRTFREEITTALAKTDTPWGPSWLENVVKSLGKQPRLERIPGAAGLILVGPARAEIEDESAYADGFDARSLSADAEGISLAHHSDDVETAVRRFATHCLPASLQSAPIAAAPVHDVGKLDRRFQVLLHGGDEAAGEGEPPLAKSPNLPMRQTDRAALAEDLRLPRGFRHEMLSLQLAEHLGLLDANDASTDLTLHVIASHHGHARPFAPGVEDPAPPEVDLAPVGVSAKWSAVARGAATPTHRLDSGVAERFWRLTRRHGWWGLAYVETIFRLGDWQASRQPSQKPEGGRPLLLKPVIHATVKSRYELVLPAIDGANPLGFLAALGTAAVLSETDSTIKLGWRPNTHWTPYLESAHPIDAASVIKLLATSLRGKAVDALSERKRDNAQRRFDSAKKKLKEAVDGLKKQKLVGKYRDLEWDRIIAPLERKLMCQRRVHLGRLKMAVPSPELALGQRPDCTISEFREHATSMRISADITSHTAIDLLAAFGAELEPGRDQRISPTPFCFITGSGHQWFLDTARQLMAAVSEVKIREALFEPWAYRDEKFTMRWDPLDDRRYGLMDRDPTASGNKSCTIWMANLLAYRALAFFPCSPQAHVTATVGWAGTAKSLCFTWPIWESPLDSKIISSLLCHTAFGGLDRSSRYSELHSIGVAAMFRSRRIQVGNPPLHKINFSPATAL